MVKYLLSVYYRKDDMFSAMKKALLLICSFIIFFLCACQTEIIDGTQPAETGTASTPDSETAENTPDYRLPYDIMELYTGETMKTDELSFDTLSVENGNIVILSSDQKTLTGVGVGETLLTAARDGEEAQCLIRVKRLPGVAKEEPEITWTVGKYRLLVNKCRNYVVIYAWEDEELKKPLKAMICSSGENTPSGSYSLSSRKVWNRLYGGVWGKYATVICGDILFHSVPYYEKDNAALEAAEYNKLGTTASAGCIRLTVADAKWIFDYCESGSRVIFTDENSDCPLSVTPAMTLQAERCWDPTDPDPENPWLSKVPVIEGEDLLIGSDAGKTLSEIFKARDTVGNDITERLVYDASPDLSVPGYYRLCLTVTDDLGRSARKIVTLRVLHENP